MELVIFGLSVAIAIGVIVIAGLIYHIMDISNQLKNEIMNIENKFPECPECPRCPDCDVDYPDSVECPKCPKCPDCPTLDGSTEPNNISGSPQKCPPCPDCNPPDCPSVDEIVTGVFPGRNPKVMSESRYADINPANSYDGLSTTNFYEQNYKFPMDSILNPGSPIRKYNKQFNSELLNNSIENSNINGSNSVSLTN